MSGDGPPVKLRGRPVVLPSWWLERANDCWKTWKKEHGGMQTLADALSEAYDRKLLGERWSWDRKTVERFLDDENPTKELMDAFCKLFPDRLIPPMFIAESPEEAAALRKISDGFRATPVNPEKAARHRELVDERREIEQRARRQIETLESRNDAAPKGSSRGPGRRRTRGMGRGGSSPS